MKELKYTITDKLNKLNHLPTEIQSNKSFNELEIMAEELESVKIHLDSLGAPKSVDIVELSVVGRINKIITSPTVYVLLKRESIRGEKSERVSEVLMVSSDFDDLVGYANDFVRARSNSQGSKVMVYCDILEMKLGNHHHDQDPLVYTVGRTRNEKQIKGV